MIWSDEPANDSVRLSRIYRMLNEGLWREQRACETCGAFFLTDVPPAGMVRCCRLWSHGIPVGVDYCSWWRVEG